MNTYAFSELWCELPPLREWAKQIQLTMAPSSFFFILFYLFYAGGNRSMQMWGKGRCKIRGWGQKVPSRAPLWRLGKQNTPAVRWKLSKEICAERFGHNLMRIRSIWQLFGDIIHHSCTNYERKSFKHSPRQDQ